jgi:UDPglucose 6-dehydrogenase
VATRVAVIGTGYVGLIQAVGLADFGNYVTGVDLRPEIVERLSRGEPTIFEHGLADYLERNLRAGRLTFTTNAGDAIPNADVVFVAVGTPEASDGSADLSQIRAVVKDVAEHATGFTLVVTKSTVPVGTNRWIASELNRLMTPDGGREFVVVSNPEFLREGRAVQDFFHPDRIVIGLEAPTSEAAARAREILEDLYRPLYLISTPITWTNLETAELIKYASNAFLATKITFINQMANLAEAVGADVHVVARTMGMDGRISPKFLHPGPGYGGSCFPKDTKAVASTGDLHGVDMSLIKAVVAGNEAQKLHTAQKVGRMLGGTVSGKIVAILGVAFKAETDDIRDSPALTITRHLLDAGATIRVHDPKAVDNFRSIFAHQVAYFDDEFDCLTGADCAVILTEWNAYRNLDLPRAATLMRNPILIDTRNVLDPTDARSAGFTYSGTGR